MVKKREPNVNENYYFLLLIRTDLTFSVVFFKMVSLYFLERDRSLGNPVAGGRREVRKKGGELFFVDDRPYMFSIQGFGDIPFLQTIDDLNLVNHLAVLQNLEARAFDD